MLEEFIYYFRKEELFLPNEKGLLAVSGGMDSMVMVDLYKKAELPFELAHCNFKLRGEESERDEDFLREFAEKNSIPLHTTAFETEEYAKLKGISLQMAARELRYKWLEKKIEEHHLDYIATGHHINDSLETVLLNLTRGTGISGVRGILPKVGKVARPLLFANRQMVQEYAREHNIAFVEDSSNAALKYDRNMIRHRVIPVLKELNPNLENTFRDTLLNLQGAESIYYETITRCTKKLMDVRGHDYYISIKKLRKMMHPQMLLNEVLKPFGFNKNQVNQLFDILDEPPGRIFESVEYKVVKDRKHIIITHMSTEESGYIHLYPEAGEINLKNANIQCSIEKKVHLDIPKDNSIACLDFAKLEFPLVLRRWQKGDYFYPFGMTKQGSDKVGKKKVSDFFTDQKIPLHDKEKVWILTSEDKIVWVAGYRIDDRYKVTENTETIFQLKFNPL